MAQRLQEATLQPETAPTVSPAYPAYPKLQEQAYPWYPAYTAFKKAPGATQTTRLQDCIASQQRA